jgi:ribose-phosphate pyrophosphokinase
LIDVDAVASLRKGACMLYLNGQPVPITIFPDKTSQVWKLPTSTFESKKAHVLWSFENEAEVMHLAQLQRLLSHNGIETTLEVTYLPYARQDKRIANDTTFAFETFLFIVRHLYFHKLIVHDPHNWDAVRPGCMAQAVYPERQVVEVANAMKTDIVCYPDKGALAKYTEIYEFPYMYGEKVRDQATGNILSYSIVGDPADKNVLIVDDICDGGMTFRLLARDLLAAGAKSVVLFVTHGIFSKGLQVLKDSGIQRIFTQDGEAIEEAGQIIYRRL